MGGFPLGAGGYGSVPGLLDFLVERLLGTAQLECLGALLQAGAANLVAGRELIEDGDAQGQAHVLAEVVAQLVPEALGAKGRVVVGAHASAQRERGGVRGLGNLELPGSTLEANLLGLNLRADAQGIGIDVVGMADDHLFERYLGTHHREAFPIGKFQQLGQREQGSAHVVLCLDDGHLALGEGGLLLGEFGR